LGYVKTAAAASGLLALAVLLTGVAPTSLLVVVAAGLMGLFGGVVLPATASMLGLETPREAQSTVFGINASSVAMGFFLGPLIGGTVAAATSDVSSALYVIAGLSMALAALLSTQAREPAR
jgi:DHA1 family multidrug resistance protein-like MFS transporter